MIYYQLSFIPPSSISPCAFFRISQYRYHAISRRVASIRFSELMMVMMMIMIVVMIMMAVVMIVMTIAKIMVIIMMSMMVMI